MNVVCASRAKLTINEIVMGNHLKNAAEAIKPGLTIKDQLENHRSSPEEVYNLGRCYEEGGDCMRDVQLAVECYELAAGQNHASAQFRLGLRYEKGHGAEKNLKKAIEYYILSADQGNTDAQFRLKYSAIVHEDPKAMEWHKRHPDNKDVLLKARIDEDADALCAAGKILYLGRHYKDAIDCYQKSASKKNPDAPYLLGEVYLHGHGVMKNHKTARHYYELSVERGNACAQFKLGCMYFEGVGGKKDIKKTIQYWELSAGQGHHMAQYNLGNLYCECPGAQHDIKKRSSTGR
jgi:uncharacterized protein